MSARISPLRLDSFELLPKHARRCVFWEVDPDTLARDDRLADPEFEKESWLSMVMLEWGSCGQVAQQVRGPGHDSDAARESDQPCLGYVFYAPPHAVPRAQRLPTGPVSADAVLLTSMGVEPGQESDGLPHSLIANVVAELVRRGVRAVEAFGRTSAADQLTALTDDDSAATEATAVKALGDCAFDQCMISADFLTEVGFVVVAPHPYFPRLRLELDRGLGWKAEVEAALERLLESTTLQQSLAVQA